MMQEKGKIPSIRKLAAELNVDGMAIYHYFPNKAALLEAVTVSLMEVIYNPLENGDWKEELRKLCKSYLQLLGQYGDLLETMLSITSDGPAQVFIRRYNKALSSLDLNEQTRKNGLDLIADYLHGFALAMRCGPTNSQLTLEDINGPLSLYINGLEAESGSQP